MTLKARVAGPEALEPVDALPAWAADWCIAVSEARQVPLEMAAATVWALLAGAVARKVYVRSGPDSWGQECGLYVATIVSAAERKSSLLNAAAGPVRQLENERLEGHALNNGYMAKRWFADDSTPEALADTMGKAGERICVLTPEGGVLDALGGQYTGGRTFLTPWLKFYDGDTTIVDRKTSAHVRLVRPTLTLGVAVQPDVITRLLGVDGTDARGLLARFAWSWPASLVGTRRTDTTPVPTATARAYERNMCVLWSSLDAAPPTTLTLDRRAAAELVAFEEWLEPQMAEGARWGDESMRKHANRTAGRALRLAAIRHVTENLGAGFAPRPVSAVPDELEGAPSGWGAPRTGAARSGLIGPEDVAYGVGAARWWLESAEDTFDKLARLAVDPRRVKVEAALRTAGEGGVNRRNLYEVLSWHVTKRELDEIVDDLVDAGLAARMKVPTTGRPAEVVVWTSG